MHLQSWRRGRGGGLKKSQYDEEMLESICVIRRREDTRGIVASDNLKDEEWAWGRT